MSYIQEMAEAAEARMAMTEAALREARATITRLTEERDDYEEQASAGHALRVDLADLLGLAEQDHSATTGQVYHAVRRLTEERDALREAVARLSGCPDHADGCCAEWCQWCARHIESSRALDAALAADTEQGAG